MNKLDLIFSKFTNQTIVLSPLNRKFISILSQLIMYFDGDFDEAIEFLGTEGILYAKKYNIKFISDPEEEPSSAPSDIDLKPREANEVKRMMELAGLYEKEEKEVKETFDKDQVLTFNSEEDRDRALEWLRESSNYPKEIKKYLSSRLYYKPEDAVSILFPTDNNLNEGLDERKFIGIVEIIHRAINKTIPNSRTIKIKK